MEVSKYTIFDDLIEGIQIVDSDFRYCYVNNALVKHAKYSRDDLIGYTMMEKYPGIENTEVFSRIKKCFEDGIPNTMINEFEFPDGSKGYFELRIQRVKDGVMVLSIDETDKIRAQNALKDLNKNLESEVRKRTKEITHKNEIIKENVDRLKELNSNKDKFFSIVAHDLRSPLGTLSAFTNLLIGSVEEFDKEKIVEISRDLNILVDNTVKMADNIIIWAQVQMNDLSTKVEHVDLRKLIETTVELYRNVARSKAVELTVTIPPDCFVTGDPDQLLFVVRNLISNSVKFTNPGGQVHVLVKKHPDQISLLVSDSGIGMSDHIIEKIFSTKRMESINGTSGEKGTGLGLRLCHEFLKLNGGKIRIESTEGVGTEIEVMFGVE